MGVILLLVSLSACSTYQHRATIPTSHYRDAAQQMYTLGLCNVAGFTGVDTVKEGVGYIGGYYLGSQYSPSALDAAYREVQARMNLSEEDVPRLRGVIGLTDEEAEFRQQLQGVCANFVQNIVKERQRRQMIARQNARQQQRSINSMAQQLGNMGQMMMNGGSRAMQMTQPMVPIHQPSFGLPSTGYSHSLINSPGGLRQRHCTSTSGSTQYCFE